MLFVDSPVFKMQGGHCCSDVGLYHCKIEVQETMAWINTVETVDVPSLVTLAPQKTRCRGRNQEIYTTCTMKPHFMSIG